MSVKPLVIGLFGGVVLLGGFLFTQLSSELTPPEDRGNLIVFAQAPEGSGFEYTNRVMGQVEDILMTYVESGEAQRIMVVAPGFGDAGTNRFSSGIARVFLTDWEHRHRSGAEIETEMNARFAEIPGATVRARMQNPFQGGGGGGGGADGASIVLLGSTYEGLAAVAERIMDRMRESPNFQRPRMNYQPTSPRVLVDIDRERNRSAVRWKRRWARAVSTRSPIAARNITSICRRSEMSAPISPTSLTNMCARTAPASWCRSRRW
jgi:multidrug efflux pump